MRLFAKVSYEEKLSFFLIIGVIWYLYQEHISRLSAVYEGEQDQSYCLTLLYFYVYWTFPAYISVTERGNSHRSNCYETRGGIQPVKKLKRDASIDCRIYDLGLDYILWNIIVIICG